MAQWFAFVVVPDCKAKSSRVRVQFQILWKIWGKGEQRDCGLTMDFQFWMLLKIPRGMILTWLTSCYCSAFEIFLKPHKQRRFPRSGHLRIGALRQQPPSLGFKSKQFALSILSSSLQGGEHFKRGRMQGWSFISALEILLLSSSVQAQRGTILAGIGIIPSPFESSCHKFFSSSHGRKMGRVVGYSTWDNCFLNFYLNIVKKVMIFIF